MSEDKRPERFAEAERDRKLLDTICPAKQPPTGCIQFGESNAEGEADITVKTCICREHSGDNDDCPIHGGIEDSRGEATDEELNDLLNALLGYTHIDHGKDAEDTADRIRSLFAHRSKPIATDEELEKALVDVDAILASSESIARRELTAHNDRIRSLFRSSPKFTMNDVSLLVDASERLAENGLHVTGWNVRANRIEATLSKKEG